MTDRMSRSISAAVLGALMMLAASSPAWSAKGEPRYVGPEVRAPLLHALQGLGYVIEDDWLDFERAISAYLWDNRQRIADLDVERGQEIDLTICLLSEDHSALAEFTATEPLASWCKAHLKTGADE